MSKTPPRRVPIGPHTQGTVISDYRANVIIVKDEEKIKKILDLAQELELEANVFERADSFESVVIFSIPYKKKVIIKK